MMIDRYRDRVNAANLARQAEPVRAKAKEILEQLRRIDNCLYWSIDGTEEDGGMQWAFSLIEHAHTLIDLAHDYRAVLAVHPALRESEEEMNQDNPCI